MIFFAHHNGQPLKFSKYLSFFLHSITPLFQCHIHISVPLILHQIHTVLWLTLFSRVPFTSRHYDKIWIGHVGSNFQKGEQKWWSSVPFSLSLFTSTNFTLHSTPPHSPLTRTKWNSIQICAAPKPVPEIKLKCRSKKNKLFYSKIFQLIVTYFVYNKKKRCLLCAK